MTISMLQAWLILGCSYSRKALPSPKTNAGSCLISVTKLTDGNVRFSVYNVTGKRIGIQRHGDLWGNLYFESQGLTGRWSRLDKVKGGVDEDFGVPVDLDWVSLVGGDETSWILNYNDVGRMKVGDTVRLHWEATDPMPSTFESHSRFPNPPLDLLLVVRPEPVIPI